MNFSLYPQLVFLPPLILALNMTGRIRAWTSSLLYAMWAWGEHLVPYTLFICLSGALFLFSLYCIQLNFRPPRIHTKMIIQFQVTKKENRNSIKKKKKGKKRTRKPSFLFLIDNMIILQEGQRMCDMNKDTVVRKISLLGSKMSQDWDHPSPVQRGGDLPCQAGSKALVLAMAIEITQSLFSPTLPLWQFLPCSKGLSEEMGMHWFSSSEPLEILVSSAKLLQSSACFKSQLYMASDKWFFAFIGRRACFGSDRLS